MGSFIFGGALTIFMQTKGGKSQLQQRSREKITPKIFTRTDPIDGPRIPTWKFGSVFFQLKCTPSPQWRYKRCWIIGSFAKFLKMPQNAFLGVSNRICHDKKATQKDVADYELSWLGHTWCIFQHRVLEILYSPSLLSCIVFFNGRPGSLCTLPKHVANKYIHWNSAEWYLSINCIRQRDSAQSWPQTLGLRCFPTKRNLQRHNPQCWSPHLEWWCFPKSCSRQMHTSQS